MAGRVSFTPDNVKSSGTDFPKLKLQQVGEHARIVCLEEPLAAYIHTLRKPKIINGRPQITTEKRKDGTEYQDYVKDFVGQPLCLGDEGILAERGQDPKNCPICSEATSGDMFDLPKRRFAMHVIKYLTVSGSTNIQNPFQVQTVVWAFTENVFNKIVAVRNEVDDLRQHDLLLGPLQPPVNFQKFDISVSLKAEWMASSERQQLTIATFQQNQAPDLEAMIGRRTPKREYLLDDIEKVKDAWAIVNGMANVPRYDAASAVGGGLTAGLEGLGIQQPAQQPQVDPWAALGGPQPQAAVDWPPAPVQVPLAQPVQQPAASPFDALAALGQPAQPVQQPAQQPVVQPVPEVTMPNLADIAPAVKPETPDGSQKVAVSFDDLLKGL